MNKKSYRLSDKIIDYVCPYTFVLYVLYGQDNQECVMKNYFPVFRAFKNQIEQYR